MTGGGAGRQAGDRLGRYRIVRRLGSGAMGEVYLAEDPQIERRLAVKTVRLQGAEDQVAERKQRLLREAKAAGRLLHPHVVTLFDAGEDDGTVFLAFEYVDGPDLGERLRTGGTVPLEEALRLVRQCAGALEAAHARSVVHRDIKPANILLTPEGDAKVADFGIAKVVGQQTELTTTGTVIGSPQYMSPEQVRGEPLDGRTDLFSLGTVLYELLTGSRAFSGDTITTLVYQILHQEPVDLAQLRPDLPPALVRLVRRMMAKDRDKRVASASEVVAEIDRIERSLAGAIDQPTRLLDSEQTAVPPPPPATPAAAAPPPPPPGAQPAPAEPSERRVAKAKSSSRRLWLALVPVLLLAAGGLGWWLWPRASTPAVPAATVAEETSGSVSDDARARTEQSTAGEVATSEKGSGERTSESAGPGPAASTRESTGREPSEDPAAPSEPPPRRREESEPAPSPREATNERGRGPAAASERERAGSSLPRQAAAATSEQPSAAPPEPAIERAADEPEATEIRAGTPPPSAPSASDRRPARPEGGGEIERRPPLEERFPIQLRLETGLEIAFDVDPKEAYVQFRGRGDRRFTQAGQAEEYSGSRRDGALLLPGAGQYLIRLRAQDRADYVIVVEARPGRPRQTLQIDLAPTGRGPRPLHELPRRRAREGVVIEGPPRADVVVNGVARGSIRELGDGLRLPPGLHRIAVEFRGRRGEIAVEITPEAEEAMVTLAPGGP